MQWLASTFGRLHLAFQHGWYAHDPHASLRQKKYDIDDEELEDAICRDVPEVIDVYPKWGKGPAVLIRAEGINRRVLHVLCIMKDPIVFYTCYQPDPDQWDAGFRKRRMRR